MSEETFPADVRKLMLTACGWVPGGAMPDPIHLNREEITRLVRAAQATLASREDKTPPLLSGGEGSMASGGHALSAADHDGIEAEQ